MAAGALRVSGADLAVAITGIAGPDGGTPSKPVGTVWICAAVRRGATSELIPKGEFFAGNRALIRRRSVEYALQLILGIDVPARAAQA